MDKIIVLGKGFLGTRISEELDYQLMGREEVNPIDFSDLEKFLDSVKPDVLINTIAKTGRPNIDWCETNIGPTLESNVLVPANLSLACSERGIYFVHFSSGCVYDGDNNGRGFSEKDMPNFYGPQFYALTKILAERILEKTDSLILRPRMPIDYMPNQRNLITKLSSYPSVIDEQNSMTTIPHMIPAISLLIKKRALGIYNLVNPGTISAKEIIEMYKKFVKPEHKFKVISLNELNHIILSKRSNCYLNTDKLKSEGINLPEIHNAVEECLLRYKEEIR